MPGQSVWNVTENRSVLKSSLPFYISIETDFRRLLNVEETVSRVITRYVDSLQNRYFVGISDRPDCMTWLLVRKRRRRSQWVRRKSSERLNFRFLIWLITFFYGSPYCSFDYVEWAAAFSRRSASASLAVAHERFIMNHI
jgi:hypothetical protein